ncbi:hypothetical protein FOA52_003909 [Chlamydomonas sp. UWO 241]|nr:hypothetical protein FOA52_003909 [Chlamydomonas sp. UWO 241]
MEAKSERLAGFKAGVPSLAAILAAVRQRAVVFVETRVPTRVLRLLAHATLSVAAVCGASCVLALACLLGAGVALTLASWALLTAGCSGAGTVALGSATLWGSAAAVAVERVGSTVRGAAKILSSILGAVGSKPPARGRPRAQAHAPGMQDLPHALVLDTPAGALPQEVVPSDPDWDQDT